MQMPCWSGRADGGREDVYRSVDGSKQSQHWVPGVTSVLSFGEMERTPLFGGDCAWLPESAVSSSGWAAGLLGDSHAEQRLCRRPATIIYAVVRSQGHYARCYKYVCVCTRVRSHL